MLILLARNFVNIAAFEVAEVLRHDRGQVEADTDEWEFVVTYTSEQAKVLVVHWT